MSARRVDFPKVSVSGYAREPEFDDVNARKCIADPDGEGVSCTTTNWVYSNGNCWFKAILIPDDGPEGDQHLAVY